LLLAPPFIIDQSECEQIANAVQYALKETLAA